MSNICAENTKHFSNNKHPPRNSILQFLFLQLREMRLELEEMHSSRVQEDVISKAESRVKELENFLRTEERCVPFHPLMMYCTWYQLVLRFVCFFFFHRNKAVLTSTISKLERRINELSDQMEDEHRIANEQKDLVRL